MNKTLHLPASLPTDFVYTDTFSLEVISEAASQSESRKVLLTTIPIIICSYYSNAQGWYPIPSSTLPLSKLTVPQLAGKFYAYYGT
jgi:hypothetical protein